MLKQESPISFAVYTQGRCTQQTPMREKGNQLMKRSGMLQQLLWLGGLIVFLAACTSLPAQSTRISPTPTVQSAQASPSSAQPVGSPSGTYRLPHTNASSPKKDCTPRPSGRS